jgi:hypothetical protein
LIVSGHSFALAGFPFRVEAAPGAPLLPLPEPYRPFLESAPDHPPAAHLILEAADHTLPAPTAAVPAWSCETWRLRRTPDDSSVLEIHTLPHDRWVTVAEADAAFTHARLRPVFGRLGAPSDAALNYPSDQVLLTNRLLRLGAVVLHACGVVMDGRGYVFCGRSGIGKTTMARMWRNRGAILLNDDRIILRLVDGEVRLFSSPWHGEEREVKAGNVPLAGFFHLTQAPAHRLSPLTGALAGARLVATAIAPFYAADGIACLLEQAERLTAHAPSYDLAFAREPSVVDVCLQQADQPGSFTAESPRTQRSDDDTQAP